MARREGPRNEGELIRDIRGRILAYEAVADWQELRWLVERPTRPGRATWDLCLDGCRALGGDPSQAWPAASVIFCLLSSIHLVDDMLDEDPEGMHHKFGEGGCANAALALQSVATRLLAEMGLEPEAEIEAHRRLGEICLGTAYGQMLDSQDLAGEEAYWRVVDLKTPPLFSYALFIGGLSASGDPKRSARLADLGFVMGRMIQMSDDLKDALERPAAPDWQRQATNLALLYATSADYPEREEFLHLKSTISEPGHLEKAQELLVRSGAFSYCSYQLIKSYREARNQIRALELPNPQAMVDVFEHYVRPLKKLLASAGVEAPSELFEEVDA